MICDIVLWWNWFWFLHCLNIRQSRSLLSIEAQHRQKWRKRSVKAVNCFFIWKVGHHLIYICRRHPAVDHSCYPIDRKLFFLFSCSTKIWVNKCTDLAQRLGVRHTHSSVALQVTHNSNKQFNFLKCKNKQKT